MSHSSMVPLKALQPPITFWTCSKLAVVIRSTGSLSKDLLFGLCKAFDHIDQNVLEKKLIYLGVRRSLIAWLCSFLSDRRQAVRTGNFAAQA